MIEIGNRIEISEDSRTNVQNVVADSTAAIGSAYHTNVGTARLDPKRQDATSVWIRN